MRTSRTLSLFTAFFLSAFACELFAQAGGPVFRTLSIENGLSQSIVNAMVQDRQGFMWFVTEDGLNRYDGYTFRTFKHDAKDQGSLVHNEIKCIREGSDGKIWIGSFYRGLECFDPATERFTHFRHDPADPASLGHDIVWAVLEDHRGSLWAGTGGGGLDLLDRRSGKFTHFRHDPDDPDSLPADDVRSLYEDKSGAIWIGTCGGGLCRMDPATGSFTNYQAKAGDPTSLSSNDVRAIVQDRAGRIWVGTNGGGLCGLDRAGGNFRRFRHDPGIRESLANNVVLALQVDDAGMLWVGTDGGGLQRLVNTRLGTFATYRHVPNHPQTLASDRIYSLYLDRSSVLWAGTYGSGVSRCDLKRKEFTAYYHDPSDPSSLGDSIVWSFCEPQEGVLWVGTNDGGLDRMERSTGLCTHFRHDPADPGSLSHDSVRMVIADRSGNIWLATNGGGLDRLDPKKRIFSHFRHDASRPESLSHDELRMVFEDSAGTIWVGTYGGGLDRWEPATGGFAHYRCVPDDPATISSDYVRTAFEDREGNLWFGTHGGGLNRFDRKLGTFVRYRNDPVNPMTLSNDFVFSIHEDASGTLWVATYGGGLNRMDRTSGTFTAVRKSDGLPDDAIYGILEDKSGNLWLSTNAGIARYSPSSSAVRGYTAEDGLQSNEFNGGAYYQNGRGEMFFGGVNGFNVFDPGKIVDDQFKANVVLTDFQISNHTVPIGKFSAGRTILDKTISYSERVQLEHVDQVVSFEFSALDYAAPEKNRYAYRLEGLQDQWTDLGTRRFVMFTTLPAGRYLLRVKATNSDGVWNEDGASLAIIIRPPWWRSLWAYILYLTLLSGAVFAIVRFERAREREKGELVEAELRMQTAELQSRVAETEARALKAENERKRRELEQARELQLSMLPSKPPDHPRYTIAAQMRTATEVGGDYYDFHAHEDGRITVAIGDATGHGTRAGIMVALMKSLFARLCCEPELEGFFAECNKTLREISLGRMYMALGLVRLNGASVQAVGAAMPPLFIHRAETGRVERYPLSGMFLGTELDLPYERVGFAMVPGDTMLLVSDGYLEQAGAGGEQLYYERCSDYFAEAAGNAPERIVARLLDRFDSWRGQMPQADDVTLVVIQAKNGQSEN